MCTTRCTIWGAALLLLSSSWSPAATIGFVTDNGLVESTFDIFWVERLEQQGRTVTPLPQTFDPASAEAGPAELFIVSNDVASGDFAAGGIVPEVPFTGFQGFAWYGGADMDAGFAGGPPRLFTLNPVDVSAHDNVQLRFSAAARPTGWDEGQDLVTFSLDVDGNNNYETLIADFQPLGGDMNDMIGGTVLTDVFEEIVISIPDNVNTLRLQIDAFSTATGEQFGFDHLRITGNNGAITIATEDFEGGPGQIGFTAQGRGGAGAAFWDVVRTNVEGVSPRVSDPRPMIVYETALFDEIGLGETGNTNNVGTAIEIENAAHPLAASFTGPVTIYNVDQIISELGPEAAGTQVIATNGGVPVIAVLEKGAESLNGSPAPGRRMMIFANDDGDGTAYTNDGLALLDAAVVYGLSGIVGPDGDFDHDGDLDVIDVNSLIGAIVAGMHPAPFDLTGDSRVDTGDLENWVKVRRFTWFGDANLDGEFNSSDFVQVFQAGKFEFDVAAGWQDGDWNGDGRFNSGDFVKAFHDGGFEKGPRAAVASVPEPSSMALLGFALVVALTRSRLLFAGIHEIKHHTHIEGKAQWPDIHSGLLSPR
jgi:hypothetical protein